MLWKGLVNEPISDVNTF